MTVSFYFLTVMFMHILIWKPQIKHDYGYFSTYCNIDFYADYFMIFFEMEECGYLSLDFQVQNSTYCISKIIFFLMFLAW